MVFTVLCLRSIERPTLVTSLSGRRVVGIAAGSNHSAAYTEDGTLYTWGKGSYGRLGHGEEYTHIVLDKVINLLQMTTVIR